VALQTEALSIGYPQRKPSQPVVIAKDLSLELDFGEVVCLVGPNGAGKSTLLRTLSGLQTPLSGRTLIGGSDVRHLDLAARARTIAVVLTERASVGLLSAADLVALGRHPHTDWAGRMMERDREVVDWALESVGASDFRNRAVHELSDGERQKVMIARALAQEPSTIILDEPTAYLDIPRRVEIIGLLKDLTRSTNRAVLLSTHDLDLAIRAADRLWLMSSRGSVHSGAPEDLVLSGELESVFQAEGVRFDPAHGSFHVAAEPRGRVHLSAPDLVESDIGLVWTRRALRRAGFDVAEGSLADSDITIRAFRYGEGYAWQVAGKTVGALYEAIEEITLRSRDGERVCESER
jgi:iron complex transport system ATP-binding protein